MALTQNDVQEFKAFANAAIRLAAGMDDNDPAQRMALIKLLEVAGLMKRFKPGADAQLPLIESAPVDTAKKGKAA